MTSIKTKGGTLHAILATLLLCLTTMLGFIPIFWIGLFKLFPNRRWKVLCTRAIDRIVTVWCSINNTYIAKAQKIEWNITGLKILDPNHWYLIIANHQSWLDIVVLQALFNKKIPVLKFFVKDQLKWIPFLGFAWWAMGCPFMKRYSKAYLEKNPGKKGKDLLATQKAIDRFKDSPATMVSFVEGTRFTPEKREKQQFPYNHLLKPKAGGISFIISAMGHQINSFLDVTIVYPDKNHSLWDFLCKRMQAITVYVRELPIPSQFINGKLVTDHHRLQEFKHWLNAQWAEKDNLIHALSPSQS